VNKNDLRVDWATHEAAKYACEHWHYSGCVPNQKTVKVGVWERNKFVGVVLFGDGANAGMFAPYGLTQDKGCELVRIALANHEAKVSRIVSIALKFLKRVCGEIRLVISFADPEQGHHGGIYQAGGWVYTGMTLSADEYLVNGKRMHGRALRSTRSTHKKRLVQAKNILEWTRKVIDQNVRAIPGSSKHRYLMPLDDEMRARVLPLSKPYPKRPKQAEAGPPEMRQCDTDPDAPTPSHGGHA
jgi:hypothetical protein